MSPSLSTLRPTRGTWCAVTLSVIAVVGSADVDTTSLVDLAPTEVRVDFAAGIVALHDFWYEEAERRFQAVQRGAPRFTLGYWGEAMAQHQGPFGFAEPPVSRMREILERLAPSPAARAALAASDHERAYLAALEVLIADEGTTAERHPAYARAMAALARRYASDIEALAFSARATLLEAESFGRSIETQRAVAAAAARVLEQDPDHHGGLHYYIHGMDSRATAREALEAADRYQVIAAGASHAVHMPSHIYIQLGMWDRVVEGNQAALQASIEGSGRAGGPRVALDRHAMAFLFYAFLQQGRDSEARSLLLKAREDAAADNGGSAGWFEAHWSAQYAVELGARADVELAGSRFGAATEVLGYGLHAIATGDRTRAATYLEQARDEVEEDASPTWRIVALELEAALDGGAGAIPLLHRAIELQSELPRPNETPVPVKPPEELLGEILLSSGQPGPALDAFRAAGARWASRLASRLGESRALAALGDTARSREAYASLLEQLRLSAADHPARAEATRFLESSGGIPDQESESLRRRRQHGDDLGGPSLVHAHVARARRLLRSRGAEARRLH